jgi:hypothetical protein
LEGISWDASTNSNPWGFKQVCCEAPILASTLGYVEVAIFMVFTNMGNVKSVTIGISEGNGGCGVLDVKKTLLHELLCKLGCRTFCVQTAHGVPVSLTETLILAVLLKY